MDQLALSSEVPTASIVSWISVSTESLAASTTTAMPDELEALLIATLYCSTPSTIASFSAVSSITNGASWPVPLLVKVSVVPSQTSEPGPL